MSASNSDNPEPNLTPILDLVFQLITFFMLVINFKGASMDLTLKLPVLGSARPLEWRGQYEPLTLNVDSSGGVKAYGQPVEIEEFLAQESRLLKASLKDSEIDAENGLPVPVIIRADKSVPFKLLNEVIKTCQNEGYRQFQLSAMSKVQEG